MSKVAKGNQMELTLQEISNKFDELISQTKSGQITAIEAERKFFQFIWPNGKVCRTTLQLVNFILERFEARLQ
ncbi:MAG: hypothetical protein JHC33_11795 [Ignisphaera sp.]|jgi:hypothetical protein|nr:hypothetical protein [Ignisphaera sp.]